VVGGCVVGVGDFGDFEGPDDFDAIVVPVALTTTAAPGLPPMRLLTGREAVTEGLL
jgi:hypothetical protein